MLNDNNEAVKSLKCTVFAEKNEWLAFKLSITGQYRSKEIRNPFKKKKRPENVSDIRSLIGSMNQFIRLIPNMADATMPFRDLMKNHSRLNGPVNKKKRSIL